ncbi:MAG: aminopeptidase P N-terminal domain-containing protein [Actinomycetia bacterium]|nr:aminopeptidase P N-terminal domain-containing protein [Actinomycetes bacterium]
MSEQRDSEVTAAPPSDQTSYDIPMSAQLRAAIARDWDPAPPMPHPARADVAPRAAARRAALSAKFPHQLIVVPAGNLKVRANDTEYAFRAAGSFTWLTGETVADAVLVMTPIGAGHDATLYVREYAGPGEPNYFLSRKHGALWVGNVPTARETEDLLGLPTRGLGELGAALWPWRDAPVAVLRGFDSAVDTLLPQSRDTELAQTLDELRLAKDSWEIDRLRDACAATARGFADVARELPNVVGRTDLRGERWLEGTFWRRARLEGNDVGYTSIVGAGRDGTVLHWMRNHNAVAPGALLLADMGVETDELYTADVTRTMPVSGAYTPDQLRVYRAVYEAQEAGIAEVKAGADFLAAHRAATWVLADHLHSWGILPVTADVSCADNPEAPGAGLHRRYTLHGVSHMLGIDVHDCAKARDETYRDGKLAAGHVLTVEPGLYFQVNDRTVPPELRGIAVRIEDDIWTTEGAPVNLSAGLPRHPDEVVAWLRETQEAPAQL